MIQEVKGIQTGIPKRRRVTSLKALSFLLILFMYGLPVYLAYLFSTFLEPIVEQYIVIPSEFFFSATPDVIFQLFVGPFGLISLGSYSFVWAFPVVVFVGVAVAITNEIGLRQKLTRELDPFLRKVGLTGADLLPIISGYGCNVVAVYQSKGCSACTKKQCLSMIAYGSACSYQVGATISLFSVAGKPWLLFPYLLLLMVVGILHTKIWYPQKNMIHNPRQLINRKVQWPKIISIMKAAKESMTQFFYQAMPIFLLICLVAASLQYYKIIDVVSKWFGPMLALLSLPEEASIGVLFSIVRKDGMLLFNEGNGQLLSNITTMELFILVYLASTLSACLVTLFAIGKTVSKLMAIKIAAKQATTSILSTCFIFSLWKAVLFLSAY